MFMNMSRVGVPRQVPGDGTLPPDEKPEINRACGGPPRSLPHQKEALSTGVAVLPYLKWKEAKNEEDYHSRIGLYGLAGKP